ncbi:uncharacterized protein HPS4 [Diabrotica undecimpunctata]|uniref:uncharacterized protein HPS4 n=1 Tax=Diabrotica undecimpunctata TaxID=50387 RepID=UPI003B6400A1
MAKEIHILFIYDTQKSQEDDEIGPILYFHPMWVPQEQKAALCGQVVGTIQCMKNIFSKPDVITLVNGKFVIIEHKQFFFVMGTDKNTPSTFLQSRAKSLFAVIEFFHKDIYSLQLNYNSKCDVEKLQDIIDSYLKMLLVSGKLFTPKPAFVLPKSSNDIFTQAIHILECCRSGNYVLGGVVSYRNRLVVTQLCSALTQLVLLTEACGVVCSNKLIKPLFSLPHEVQLYEVYISGNEYSKLVKLSHENIFQNLRGGITNKKPRKLSQKETSILSTIKREQSLLFTSVPEERPVPTFEPNFTPTTKKSRPRFLNLENTTTKSSTNKLIRQTSDYNLSSQIVVCSTPLQEQKKFVHFNPLSLCHNESKPDIVESTNNVSSNEEGKTAKLNKKIHNYISKRSQTIADPTFPVLKRDGKQMSLSFYEESEKKDVLQQKSINRSCQSIHKEDSFNFSREKSNLLLYEKSGEYNFPDSTFIPNRLKSLSFLNYSAKGSKIDNRKSVIAKPSFDFRRKKITKQPEKSCNSENPTEKCVLFQWHENNITITILLKFDIIEDSSVMNSLCTICKNQLSKLENKMRDCFELKQTQGGEQYQFITLDSTGPRTFWNGTTEDWRELYYFNDELSNNSITEVLIRSLDTSYYGYHCGPNKIFYGETTICNGGLPLPADPMGVLQVKAKRRLERDYALILF